MFSFAEGSFGYSLKPSFIFPKVPGRPFFPNLSEITTFAAAPLVLTPSVRNQGAPSVGSSARSRGDPQVGDTGPDRAERAGGAYSASSNSPLYPRFNVGCSSDTPSYNHHLQHVSLSPLRLQRPKPTLRRGYNGVRDTDSMHDIFRLPLGICLYMYIYTFIYMFIIHTSNNVYYVHIYI